MKSLLIFITVVATFLVVVATASIVQATPTTPVINHLSDIEKQYLVHVPGSKDLRLQNLRPQDADDILASIRYKNQVAENGWHYMQVHSRPDTTITSSSSSRHRVGNNKMSLDFVVPYSEYYYYGGYAEGLVSATTRVSDIRPAPKFPACETEWLDQHFTYIFTMFRAVEKNPSSLDFPTFWQQQVRIWAQLQGIADGYNSFHGTNFTTKDVYMMNFNTGGVEQHCSLKRDMKQSGKTIEEMMFEKPDFSKTTKSPPFIQSHCSGLTRVTETDLFTAQDTWTEFGASLGMRVFKQYGFGNEFEVQFTGYFYSVSSGEDWYQTSAKLSVWETTNDVFNRSLYQYVLPHNCGEFSRVMVGNYLARDGKEWSEMFSYRNDGIYNNQYNVIDFKLFKSGTKKENLPDNLLWLSEQIPGKITSADLTYYLREHGFFPSFNIPFFKYNYDISGYKMMEEEQGTFWSWSKYARSEIFSREAPLVKTLSEFQRLMRWNKYKTDPASVIPNCTGAGSGNSTNVCNPTHSSMLAIASRGDLMKVYPTKEEMIFHYGPLYDYVAQGCFGALGARISSSSMINSMTSIIINGPTNDDVPTFTWSGACNGPPANTPAVFDFPWMMIYAGN